MADEIDMANEQSERWLRQALNASASKSPRLPAQGRCHFCGEQFDKKDELADRKLFCDADRASDYEREQQRKANR